MSDPRNHHGSQLPDVWADMADSFYVKPSSEPFTFHADPPVRAIIDVGNMELHVSRRYNWIHRLMMSLIFGWTVRNV